MYDNTLLIKQKPVRVDQSGVRLEKTYAKRKRKVMLKLESLLGAFDSSKR
jgi:hypothetical protein